MLLNCFELEIFFFIIHTFHTFRVPDDLMYNEGAA